ncbi:MAG: T9SS type A sorting domain-containing protein [Polaribacter sp.]|uniref:T9SS type A sorting domain-containing protein n=1 Tax=Polaribacter sp. TaxID=1920175 RepID=UPI002F356D16
MVKKLLFVLLLNISFIGFSQEKSINNLSAAPNPFTNSTKIIFTTTSNSNITFSVKNVLGKTVYSERVSTKIGKNSIPFLKKDLAAGMYIYSIQDKKNIISKRFVIR